MQGRIGARVLSQPGRYDRCLMSEFPSVEADELVTKQFLRAELAEALHRQTVWLGGAIAGATAVLTAIGALT